MRDSNALSHGSVAALLERFHDLRLVVLGDVMLDEYRAGNVSRTSPEAPVPVVKVEDEHHCLGGAANVANVARALGANVELFGVVGDDVGTARHLDQPNTNGSVHKDLQWPALVSQTICLTLRC